jgi:hypothetical protein
MLSPLFPDGSETAYVSCDHLFCFSEYFLAFARVTVTVTVKLLRGSGGRNTLPPDRIDGVQKHRAAGARIPNFRAPYKANFERATYLYVSR